MGREIKRVALDFSFPLNETRTAAITLRAHAAAPAMQAVMKGSPR